MTALLIILFLSFHTAESDSAKVWLEKTESDDKAYRFPESDSLIRLSVDYYDRHGSRSERAKAHFYLGCVEADLFRRAEAIYELRRADRLNRDKNNHLQALIYSRLGYLLYEHNLWDEALDIYTRAEQLATLQADSVNLIYSKMQLGNILQSSDSARASGLINEAWQLAKEYTTHDTRAVVLTAVYPLRLTQGDTIAAYHAARLCMEIVPHPMRTWPAMYNLGEALFFKQEYDSAKVLLEPILGIDHSYELRANTAALLNRIALAQGKPQQAQTYSDMERAMRRSAYAALETNNVLRRQLQDMEEQAGLNRKSKIVLTIFVCMLAVVLTILGAMIVKRVRQRRSLRHQIRDMQTLRHSLVEEEWYASPIYDKLQNLAEQLKDNPFIKDNLSLQEWRQLSVYADDRFNGISTRLRKKYKLNDDEVHICLLYLFDVPVSVIGHFVKGYTRNTIQIKARQIPIRAGADKGTLLRDWLQQITVENDT